MAAGAAPVAPFIVKISADLDPERRALAVFGNKQGDAWVGLASSGARICGCAPFAYKTLETHLTTPGIGHVCPSGISCGSAGSGAAGRDSAGSVASADASVAAVRISASDAVVKRIGDWWLHQATILDIVREGWFTTKLYSALMQTGAAASLNDASETAQKYTLFAPNDSAFARLQEVPQGDELLEVLRQHLVAGVYTSQAIPYDGSTVTLQTVGGTTITLARNPATNFIIVNGAAAVVWADLHAANGVVHVVDRVVPTSTVDVPPVAMPMSDRSSVLDVIATNAKATVFRAFLARTFENTKKLSDPGKKYTVFVPVDASFEDVETEDMPASSDALSALILGHAVCAEVKPSHFKERTRVRTLSGEDLHISASATQCYVNGSCVTETINTDNGVVYFVEKLLQ